MSQEPTDPSGQEPRTLVVQCQISESLLLDPDVDPVTLRKEFGEMVYRTALLKAGAAR